MLKNSIIFGAGYSLNLLAMDSMYMSCMPTLLKGTQKIIFLYLKRKLCYVKRFIYFCVWIL